MQIISNLLLDGTLHALHPLLLARCHESVMFVILQKPPSILAMRLEKGQEGGQVQARFMIWSLQSYVSIPQTTEAHMHRVTLE